MVLLSGLGEADSFGAYGACLWEFMFFKQYILHMPIM